jgi:sugar lactone lactonase YvrE
MITKLPSAIIFGLRSAIATALRRSLGLIFALMLPAAAHAQVASYQFTGAVVTLNQSAFLGPCGVALDASGDVFFVDANSRSVKELLAASNYATAQTISSGFSQPWGVAVDGSGNVFVADEGTPNGSSAGTPQSGEVYEILADGGYATTKTLGSGFNHPNGIAVDSSENVFVTDTGNNAVYEILAAGGYTTVNSLGSGFKFPTDVAVDGSGNLFVADDGDGAIKEIVATGGYSTVKTLVKGLTFPVGVAVDADGNLFIADNGNAAQEILAVNGTIPASDPTIDTLGGGLFNFPQGISVSTAGNLFVGDSGNSALQEIFPSSLVYVPISPGGKVRYTFTLSPISPATAFASPITLSATGGPTGAIYTFSPASIAQGAGATTITLTVAIPQSTTSSIQMRNNGGARTQAFRDHISRVFSSKWSAEMPLLAFLILAPFTGRLRRGRNRFRGASATTLLLLAGIGAVAVLGGCGSGPSGGSGQTTGNFTITITATSGALTQSATVGLNVQ